VTPTYHLSPNKSYSILNLDLFSSVIDQAKSLGLCCIKITGGEPFLHPQIADFLDLVCLKEIRLNIETNGTLCEPELVEKIARCKNPFVAVSLDGADAKTHEWVRGVKGCFEATVKGIRNLVDAGLRPQIIMSIMKHNKKQMEDVVRLAESLEVGSVKFNIVQPIGKGKEMHGKGNTLTIEELVNLGQWVEDTLSFSTRLRLLYGHPLAFQSLEKVLDNNKGRLAVCNILGVLGVLANGSYAMCGIGETMPGLVFGHAATDPLEDIWNNTPILREIREGLPHRLEGICNECLMKWICRGSCIAQSYYRSGNLWTPFWFCEEAFAHGLFPESRRNPETL